MIHLRRRITSLLLLQPASPHPVADISPLLSLVRLLSSTAPVSPKPFAAEDYLVATWGLTRAQARKASKKLSHLRSPSKPDAVLAFFSELGLPPPKIAAVATTDPRLLCADVKNNLAKRVDELRGLGLSRSQIARVDELSGLGLSRSQIARLVPLARCSFRCSSLGTNLGFWLQVVGSFDKIVKALRKNSALGSDLEKVVKPNLAFLKQCGINACDVASNPTMYSSRLFTLNPMYLRDAVARVEELGLDRSKIFQRALIIVSFSSKETIAKKMRLLEELGFSQDDLLVMFRKLPLLVGLSEKKIRRSVEFLKRDVGMDEQYIAQRPALLMYSLERRLLPRHCLLKVLRALGLLNCELDYYFTAAMGEKKFLQRFVDPCKIPGLAGAYTSSCSRDAANGFASIACRVDRNT